MDDMRKVQSTRQGGEIGRLGGQGGGDDGGNDNKVRGNILSIPPLCAFIASLFETTTLSELES